MSENEKKFMDGIITVKDALRWFEDKTKKGSKYRSAVSEDKSFDIFPEDEHKNITSWVRQGKPLTNAKQYYSAANDLEADSCPTAWEHYRRHYSIGTFKKAQNGSEYSFSFLGYTTPRLVAISKNDLEKKRTSWGSTPVTASGLERLGGDCDFNFNEKKYPLFVKFLCKGKGIPTVAEIELLAKCYGMHHTLLNFSLIQGVGGMQNFKGTLCDFDRLDRFVYFLDIYYKTPKTEVRNTPIAIAAEVANRSALIHYLNQFDNIYDYCAKIYFLPTKLYHSGKMIEKVDNTTRCEWQCLFKSNQELIKDLIKWGAEDFKENSTENTIHNQNLATEYMLLAVRFWQAKEKYFELMDKIFEDEKKK